MKKIQLSIDQVLQGNFELTRLNLLFLFQVNCPKCFFYGFPVAQHLHEKYGSEYFKVLGLSTAFEHFNYNTIENTQLLLTERKTVGATKAALDHNTDEIYQQGIDFPVAMDKLVTGSALATEDNIQFFCRLDPHFSNYNDIEKSRLHQSANVFLQSLSQASATFVLNQLPGTPTFLLLNQERELLGGWVGHKKLIEIEKLLEKWLRSYDCLKLPSGFS